MRPASSQERERCIAWISPLMHQAERLVDQRAWFFCVRLCVQRRLVCSAGIKPAGAKVRRPVAWMAGWRETETLKPIDKVSLGEITSHRAVMRVNAKWPRKQMNPGAEPANEGRRQHGVPKSDRCGILISAG
jgi:hypothetical protein